MVIDTSERALAVIDLEILTTLQRVQLTHRTKVQRTLDLGRVFFEIFLYIFDLRHFADKKIYNFGLVCPRLKAFDPIFYVKY